MLERAAEKPLDSFQEQVLLSDVSAEVEQLSSLCSADLGKRRSEMNKKLVEDQLRGSLYRLISQCNLADPEASRLWSLLDVSIILEDAGLGEKSVSFSLLEELLESQILSDCPYIFDYLESRRQRLIAHEFPGSKHLNILRACNELLRRLSRAEDTVFCGRVFFFLFQIYPLHERSALNLRGFYNTANQTTWDDVPPTPPVTPPDTEMTDAEGDAKSVEVPGVATTPQSLRALYPTFWSMQNAFSNPESLFDPKTMSGFRFTLEAALVKFDEIKRELVSRGITEDTKKSLKRKRGENEVETSAAGFNPKYLTSWDLFELEISDLAFRRHILVQALIVLEFLVLTSQTSKESEGETQAIKKQASASFTLSDEDSRWISEIQSRIARYLGGPEQSDQLYYRIVETVLARDKHWARWKADNCKPFEVEAVSAEDYSAAQTTLKRAFTPRRMRAMPMGAMNLDFLKPPPPPPPPNADGSEAEMDKALQPDELPSLESFRGRILDDEFEIGTAKDEFEKKRWEAARTSKTWRALRIAARTELRLFDDVGRVDDLEAFLEARRFREEAETEAEAKVEAQVEAAAESEAGAEAKPEAEAAADGEGSQGDGDQKEIRGENGAGPEDREGEGGGGGGEREG